MSRPDITCKIPQLGQPIIPLFMYTEAHCLLKLDDPFMYIKANSDWEKVSHLCKISRYRSNFWFVHHFGLFQANYYKVKHLNQVGFIHKIKWSILKKNIGSHDHLRPHDRKRCHSLSKKSVIFCIWAFVYYISISTLLFLCLSSHIITLEFSHFQSPNS